MEPKRLQDIPPWLPPDQKQSRFGGAVSRRASESRRPLFRLVSLPSDNADELFFVNDTDETLAHVAAFTGGFITADDDALSLEGANLVYHDVCPGEGVKVEAFDGYYDLDYVFQLSFEVACGQGTWRILTRAQKGSIAAQELLWDDGSPGRHVNASLRSG